MTPIPECALDDFRKLFDDADPGVRAAAVAALASIKSNDTAALIQKASKDQLPLVRQNTAIAASALPFEQAMPILKALMADQSPDVRQAAVRQFSNWPAAREHAADVVPILVGAAKDPNAGVALAAIQGLVSYRAKEATDSVTEFYGRADASTKARMMYFVTQLPEPQNRTLLTAAAKDNDLGVRLAVTNYLRNMPGDLAMTLAGQAAADADPRVRRNVIFFLGSKQNDAQATELLKKLSTDADNGVATAARQTMERPVVRP